MTSEQLFQRCGRDAAYYLKFEKYVLAALSVMTAVGLGLLLPLYITSDGITGSPECGLRSLSFPIFSSIHAHTHTLSLSLSLDIY
jgi:hypothetical protein